MDTRTHSSVAEPGARPALRGAALEPGSLVGGKYRIERALGRGGMGEVYLAFHEQLGKRVAIKVLQAEAALDPGVRTRFRREAVAASTLASAHIAEVSDVGELTPANGASAGQPYMVMEYLQGRDLAAHLAEREKLGAAECVDLLRQLCEGVRVAHAAGVVHRDLKPANLFLVPRDGGRPLLKILDFGIAKATGSLTTREAPQAGPVAPRVGVTQLTDYGGMLGSARYMAPEQMESARDVDGRADIWSVGVVGYKLLTGRVPFEAETPEALFVAMITQPFAPLRPQRPDAPSALIEAIEGCLRPQRDDRWPTIEALAAMLALANAALASSGAALGEAPWATPSHGAPRSITQSTTHVQRLPPASEIATPRSTKVGLGMLLGVALVSIVGTVALLSFWVSSASKQTPVAGGARAVPSPSGVVPAYALADTLVDPLALLSRAQAEAAAVSPGTPLSLQTIRVHNVGPGPLRLSGKTIVLYELVRLGEPEGVTVTFTATSAFASTFELGNPASIVPTPRCNFEAARAAAVAAGHLDDGKSVAEYGGSTQNAWRFLNIARGRNTRTVDIDSTTCAVVPQKPSSFGSRY